MNFFAHRGDSRRYPENTIAAFASVLRHPLCGKSITGIEFDIHPTADYKIPVMHETSIQNLQGNSVDVANITMEELKAVVADSRKDSDCGVPDLESVLALIDHKIEACIEIKIGNYDLKPFIRAAASSISSYVPAGDVVISSFSYDILEYARRHLARLDLRYAFIFYSTDVFLSVPKGVAERFDLLHPHYKLLTARPALFIDTGKPIRCWTVNDYGMVKKIAALPHNVAPEAIMTDDLNVAESFIAESADDRSGNIIR